MLVWTLIVQIIGGNVQMTVEVQGKKMTIARAHGCAMRRLKDGEIAGTS
jgi:hypothetical protein